MIPVSVHIQEKQPQCDLSFLKISRQETPLATSVGKPTPWASPSHFVLLPIPSHPEQRTCAASTTIFQPTPFHWHEQNNMTTKHRLFTTSFASVYPLYVAKAEKKGRKKSEVDAVICWLTGYNQRQLEAQLKKQTDFETFFKEAPRLNPSRTLIKGVVCGIRVEDIQDPTMRDIRYLDKLVDELAKGKAMDKILRA